MISLAIAFLPGRRRVVIPTLRKGCTVPIISRNRHSRIIAALKNHTGLYAVQISVRRQKSIHSISVTIAPAFHRATRRIVKDSRHFDSGFAIENRQIFISAQNITAAVSIIRAIVVICRRTFRKIFSGTVFCPGSRFHRDFGKSIQVIIADKNLRIVRSRPDIFAQIDSPKFCSVQFIGIDNHISRISFLRIVLGIARIPFENQLVFPVSVQIADRNVIWRIGITSARIAPARRPIQRNRPFLTFPYIHRFVRFFFNAAFHRSNFIPRS